MPRGLGVTKEHSAAHRNTSFHSAGYTLLIEHTMLLGEWRSSFSPHFRSSDLIPHKNHYIPTPIRVESTVMGYQRVDLPSAWIFRLGGPEHFLGFSKVVFVSVPSRRNTRFGKTGLWGNPLGLT